MDMEVFLQKEHRISRHPKNWRSLFRAQNCRQEFYGHEDFSEEFSGRISRGRPGVIRADVPGQKLRAGP